MVPLVDSKLLILRPEASENQARTKGRELAGESQHSRCTGEVTSNMGAFLYGGLQRGLGNGVGADLGRAPAAILGSGADLDAGLPADRYDESSGQRDARSRVL